MKRSLTFILMLGVMLGALSGCEKEKSATEPVYNPISRLDAEVLLKQWNAERKGRLKSATTLNLTEEQWGRAKVTVHPKLLLSNMSIPLGDGLTLSLGKKGDTTSLHLLCVCPLPSYLAATGGALSEKTYTGYILVYNRRSEALFALRYQNGIFKAAHEVGFEKSLLKADIPELVIYGQRRTPLHVVYIEMGPAGGGSTADFLEYAQVSSFRVGGGGGRPLGINTKPKLPDLDTDPDPKPEVDEAGLKENPCADAAWTRLKNETSIRTLIEKFMGERSILNLTLQVSNLNGDYGNTNLNRVTNTALIEIDGGYASAASPLSVAKTFIHELIHAEIFRKLASVGYNQEAMRNNFPVMWSYWVEYNHTRQFSHTVMADLYRQTIINGLREFDHSQGIYGRDESVYNALSWGGLSRTIQWSSLSFEEQQKINSIILREAQAGGCNSNP